LKANENALRQEIQRAEQAARQQEQREREALAQKKQEEEKRTSKPYQPTDQERKLINSTSGLGTAAHQYRHCIPLVQSKREKCVGKVWLSAHQRVLR